jgi:hypothetical protein
VYPPIGTLTLDNREAPGNEFVIAVEIDVQAVAVEEFNPECCRLLTKIEASFVIFDVFNIALIDEAPDGFR